MDWDDVRHFLAVAQAGSARGAGAALGVSHSTVLRRLEALEAQLSTRLFDRARDGYSLTEAGQQMLPRAQRVATEMAALERGLVGRDERLVGTVAITCCDSFVAELLLVGLLPFCRSHPAIELALNSDGRIFDLSRREADIAIRAVRAGATPHEHLLGRPVAPLVMASYVARAHAARLAPDEDGPEARWIGFDRREVLEEMVAGSSYPHLPTWGAFTSLALMHSATRSGVGIAMLPTYVGDPDPQLRRLDRPDLRHVADLWLVSHPDLRDNARFRATRAAIVAVFEAQGARFRGELRCEDAPAGSGIAPDDPVESPVG